jgi:WD40 repeat protein
MRRVTFYYNEFGNPTFATRSTSGGKLRHNKAMSKKSFRWSALLLISCGLILWLGVRFNQPPVPPPLWKSKGAPAKLAFNPDGSALLGLSTYSGTLTSWDAETGQVAGGYSLPFDKKSGSLTAQGDRIAGLTSNIRNRRIQIITVCDASSGKVLDHWSFRSTLRHDLSYSHTLISPDGSRLCTQSAYESRAEWPLKNYEGEDEIRVWDVKTHKLLKYWKRTSKTYADSPFNSLHFLVFSPDGKHLLQCQRRRPDETSEGLLDLMTGQHIKLPLPNDPDTPFSGVGIFSPNGQYFAAHTGAGLTVWNFPKRQLLWTSPRGGGTIRFSPDNKRIACSSSGGFRHRDLQRQIKVLVGDVATGHRWLTLTEETPADLWRYWRFDNSPFTKHPAWGHDPVQITVKEEGPILGMVWSPDSQHLAVRYIHSDLKLWRVP